MDFPNRLSRQYAEERGYVVDTSCYPWIAYKGPRFHPDRHFKVFTDIEAQLLPENVKAARLEMRKRISFFVDAMYPMQAALSSQKPIGPHYLEVRDLLTEEVSGSKELNGYEICCFEYGNSTDPEEACVTVKLRRTSGVPAQAPKMEVAVSLTAEKTVIEVKPYDIDSIKQDSFDAKPFRLTPQLDTLSLETVLVMAVQEAERQAQGIAE